MLSIYLITTALSWISIIDCGHQIIDTYKTRGYERTSLNENRSEIMKSFKRPAILLCTPVINILIGIMVQLKKEEIIEETISLKISKGELVRSDIIDVEVTEYRDDDNQREIIITAEGSQNAFFNYNSMTTEEKLRVLESERDFLLREKENQIPEYENNMGEYRKDMR